MRDHLPQVARMYHQQGMSQRRIAAVLGVSQGLVWKTMKFGGVRTRSGNTRSPAMLNRFTPEEVSAARRLYFGTGLTLTATAKQMGMGHARLRRLFIAEGWKLRGRHGNWGWKG